MIINYLVIIEKIRITNIKYCLIIILQRQLQLRVINVSIYDRLPLLTGVFCYVLYNSDEKSHQWILMLSVQKTPARRL